MDVWRSGEGRERDGERDARGGGEGKEEEGSARSATEQLTKQDCSREAKEREKRRGEKGERGESEWLAAAAAAVTAARQQLFY